MPTGATPVWVSTSDVMEVELPGSLAHLDAFQSSVPCLSLPCCSLFFYAPLHMLVLVRTVKPIPLYYIPSHSTWLRITSGRVVLKDEAVTLVVEVDAVFMVLSLWVQASWSALRGMQLFVLHLQMHRQSHEALQGELRNWYAWMHANGKHSSINMHILILFP